MRDTPQGLAFRVVTYNVLADAFAKPKYYPLTTECQLNKRHRYPAVTTRLLASNADIICLQEVDADLWDYLSMKLALHGGYLGSWRPRSDSKPDGCAILWKDAAFDVSVDHLRFAELPGAKPAKRAAIVAQVNPFEHEDFTTFDVYCAHFAWEPETTPIASHAGCHEALELLRSHLAAMPLIVAGDFNAEPDHALLEIMHRHGLRDTHPVEEFTNIANGRASKVDYLLASPDFEARAELIIHALTDTMALPSGLEPSDHLPLVTDFILKR